MAIATIKTQKEFSKIYKKGTKYHNKYFVLFFMQNKSFALGLTISKKIGKAHIRNLIKRRFRSIVQNANIQNGLYIIVAKKGASDIQFSTLQKNILNAIASVKNKTTSYDKNHQSISKVSIYNSAQ